MILARSDIVVTETTRQPEFPAGANQTRRQFISRLAAAGFSAPVIASILADGAWAQDAATPVATPQAQVPAIASPFTVTVTPTTPAETLAALGVDPRMNVYGGLNIGTPIELIDTLTVPNELFFIRTHGVSVGLTDSNQYRLQVGGHVSTPLRLTLDDLKAMPQHTYTAFLECSGDSRSYFEPNATGTQWRNTSIGNGEWTGVLLRDVLNQAGVSEGAVDLVSQGGDLAAMQRGLPIETAMAENTMLAMTLNGVPIPAPHGGPVRLFVPGWGGIASTKWLIGLTVLDEPFTGSFNTENYTIIDKDQQKLRPVQVMPVKSIITSPTVGAQVSAGPVTVAGYAWSGNGGIASVDVSPDGGASWEPATITLEAGPLSWVRFKYAWQAKPGQISLASRATDRRVLTQPFTVPWNAGGYQYNAIQRVPVTVS